MPPKVKITKEKIVSTALELVRSGGAQNINARALAAELNCSTQPIFSNFATMDQLRLAMVLEADQLCQNYIRQEIEAQVYPSYKASGMAYIRFAKEEKELFRLLYMRDRAGESERVQERQFDEMQQFVRDYTGLSAGDARLFHLEMWAYVHGIATMFATGFLDLDWDLVSQMLTDAYQGMRKQHCKEA